MIKIDEQYSFDKLSSIHTGNYEFLGKKRNPPKEEKELNVKISKKTLASQPNYFAIIISSITIILLSIVAVLSYSHSNSFTTVHRVYRSGSASEINPKEVQKYSSMAVIEQDSKRLLNGYNENQKLPMASTTKIMTAVLAIENIPDLNLEVVVPSECVGIEGTSIYLKYDEKIKIIDILYGLILASGNDCATALSVICSGSEEKFVELMNSKASELGLQNTHFCNPHGLHNENHYTSAYDLACITSYAMQNELFRKIVSTKKYQIEKTNKYEVRYLKNKQKLLFDETLNSGEFQVTGVKSGFTPEAGRCLVSSAYKNNTNIICVVLNCPQMFEVSATLMQEALDKFENKCLVEPYAYIASIPVNNGVRDEVGLYVANGFEYPLCDEDEFKILANYYDCVNAPAVADDEVGRLQVVVNNQTCYEEPILIAESVDHKTALDIAKEIINGFMQ